MLNLSARQLPRFPVFNCLVPPEGSKGVPLFLNFNLASHYQIFGGLLVSLGFLELVQTLWIDTAGATDTLTVTIRGTGQRITVLKETQGYYPVLCPNQFTMDFDSNSASTVQIILLNMPIQFRRTNAVPVAPAGSDAMQFITKQDAVNVAALNFPTVFSDNPTFDDFWLEIVGLIPSTNLDDPQIQVSTDGVTYDTGANYMWGCHVDSDGVVSTPKNNGDTQFILDGIIGISNVVGKGGGIFLVRLFIPTNGTDSMRIHWNGSSPDAEMTIYNGGGRRLNATTVKGFRLNMNGGGNIKQGSVRVYGIQKA